MEFQDLQEISIDKEHLIEVINHKEYNKTIISYYERLSNEFNLSLGNQIESISNCNSWWLLDHYVNQKVKDFKKTNLCKDKFCNNCKKVKQASRLTKFMPIINSLSEDKYIYHLVLTVPNCKGSDLKDTISKIFKNFNYYLKFFIFSLSHINNFSELFKAPNTFLLKSGISLFKVAIRFFMYSLLV